jgi:lipoprotein signal peptidase
MYTYYFLFTLIFLLINFGYAFGRLGNGHEKVISVPLLVLSALVCSTCLLWIRKRYKKKGEQPKSNVTNARPEQSKE